MGLSATYTTDNFFVQDLKGQLSVGGENILTADEFQRLRTLNPDDEGGTAAFHEVIAWALNEVVARSENSAATYRTGLHVTNRGIELGTRANPADDDDDLNLRDYLKREGKIHRPIEEWDEDAVKKWINGLEGVNDLGDEVPKMPAVDCAQDAFYGRPDGPAPTKSVGECFKYNLVNGPELLQLTGTDVMAILQDGCKGDPDETGAVGKYKLVTRTKRIMANIEELRKIRGDSYSLSEDRAVQLITSILQLRQKLASLYGFHSQYVCIMIRPPMIQNDLVSTADAGVLAACAIRNSRRPVPFFYVHLLLMISLFYLPLFSYSMALDFDQLDVMCGDQMLAPGQDGAANISWWGMEDLVIVPLSTTNFCSEYIRYEVVGVICVVVQVRSAAHLTIPAPTTGSWKSLVALKLMPRCVTQNIVVIGLTHAGERMSDPCVA